MNAGSFKGYFSFLLCLVLHLFVPAAGRTAEVGFSHTSWEMTTAGGNHPVPFHKDQRELRNQVYYQWAPRPDNAWRPAPNPEDIGFEKNTGMPCEEQVIYFYFRTTLRLPPSIVPGSVHLVMGAVDDSFRVWVNGRLTNYPKEGPQYQRREFDLGHFLHSGDNAIVGLLGDWCNLSIASDATFTGTDLTGHRVEASLNGTRSITEPQPSAPAATQEVTPSESAAPAQPAPQELRVLLQPPPATRIPYADTDDWLRPRRDPANSAHSLAPLHLPPTPLWLLPHTVTDARIWDDLVLALDDSGRLYALDLKTGSEIWSLPSVLKLGDVTSDGKVAVEFNNPAVASADTAPDASYPLKLLDANTGKPIWETNLNGEQSPLAIYHDLLYVCDKDRGLLRINLSDGSLLPTTTAPLDGWETSWDSTAFTDSQILFERYPWLYALSLDDPERGTKFYAGGGHPLVFREYVVATNDLYIEGYAFHREDKWLRPVWKPNRTLSIKALCWSPVGEAGSTLQQRPNGLTNADSLALVTIPTGESVWEDPNYRLLSSLSMGNQLVVQEFKPSSSEVVVNNVSQPLLGVRDSQTGGVLWESRAFRGTPLAASRGYLLVAEEGRFFCLH